MTIEQVKAFNKWIETGDVIVHTIIPLPDACGYEIIFSKPTPGVSDILEIPNREMFRIIIAGDYDNS